MKAFMFLAIVGMFAYIAFVPPGPVTVQVSDQAVKSEPMVRIDLGEMQKNMEAWMGGWEGSVVEGEVVVGDIVVDDVQEEDAQPSPNGLLPAGEDANETKETEEKESVEEVSGEEKVEVEEEIDKEESDADSVVAYEPEPIVEEPELLIDVSVEETEEEAPVEEVNVVEELLGE